MRRVTRAGLIGMLMVLAPLVWSAEHAPPNSSEFYEVEISWEAVTENLDGNPVTNLLGYRVHLSRNPANLTAGLQNPDTGRWVGEALDAPRLVTLEGDERRYEIPVDGTETMTSLSIPYDEYAGVTVHMTVLAIKDTTTEPPYLMSEPSTVITFVVPDPDTVPPEPPSGVEVCEVTETRTLRVPSGQTMEMSARLVTCAPKEGS